MTNKGWTVTDTERAALNEASNKAADARYKRDSFDSFVSIAFVVIMVALLAIWALMPHPVNKDPRVGWVVTESNDFGPVYRHMCDGTTLIREHTSRGVHTPTYFENDPLCVA